ncbi:hypothetical protein V1478_014690 [Vespula squamosa]|uniref:Uncharacterized protein n=1 Tax=Vespula squamosa TaxID=30214 RepID=A0ABD2A2Z4_VESSQ
MYHEIPMIENFPYQVIVIRVQIKIDLHKMQPHRSCIGDTNRPIRYPKNRSRQDRREAISRDLSAGVQDSDGADSVVASFAEGAESGPAQEKRGVLLASDFSHDTLHLAQEDRGGWPSLTGSPGLLVPFAAVAVADAALLPLEEFTGRWPADVYACWITSYGQQVVSEKRVSALGHKRGARNDVAVLSSLTPTILSSFSSLSSEAHPYRPLCTRSFASNLGLAHREEENPE